MQSVTMSTLHWFWWSFYTQGKGGERGKGRKMKLTQGTQTGEKGLLTQYVYL